MKIFKTNKTNLKKLIARGILVMIIVISLILSSCSNHNIDKDKRFSLDNGIIKFLSMRSIDEISPSYGVRTQKWSTQGGISLSDDKITYTRPYISYSAVVTSTELGDGRTFYEKYINKYFNMHGSYEYSMKIHANFYAFQKEIEDLKYEFEQFDLRGETISIYNGDELIGIVSITTKLNKDQEFYIELLEKTLFVVNVDKYNKTKPSTEQLEETPLNIPPDLDYVELSYFTLRDFENFGENIEVSNYRSYFSGGYSGIFGDWEYHNVVNHVNIEFYSSVSNDKININAEFYEYREEMGAIDYVFTGNEDNGSCVELYSHSVLIGKVFYGSDSAISEEWMINFLNENLVVISVKK